MLSIFDLLEAGTLDTDLAAYLMARISKGASFMVGAVPGAAGKTTVMCALLNFIPADVRLVAATDDVVEEASQGSIPNRNCLICHEIGSGYYYAYLWGETLRKYCRLASKGYTLATNLHADNPEQAREQVCGDNDVTPEAFNAFHLLVFLRVEGGFFNCSRKIGAVYAGDGAQTQKKMYPCDSNGALTTGELVEAEYLQKCRLFLEDGLTAGLKTIEETREAVLGFLTGG